LAGQRREYSAVWAGALSSLSAGQGYFLFLFFHKDTVFCKYTAISLVNMMDISVGDPDDFCPDPDPGRQNFIPTFSNKKFV
jgi:hypothetical protein